MKTRKIVRWGFRAYDILSPEDLLVCWYHTDNATWRWTCHKEDATPMDIKRAISLMQLHDRVDLNRIFMMEFVE